MHKEVDKCDGIRNKTSYIPRDRIAELDVLSDYRLLESTSRCVDSYSRDAIKKSTRRFYDPHNIPLPPHLIKFRNACYRRGQCRLHFLPQKFERHQLNTSRLNWKKGEIAWRLQLHLPHVISPSNSVVVLENVSERTIFYELLQPYLDGGSTSRESDEEVNVGDTVIPHKKGQGAYDVYKAAGFSGCRVLLKSEGALNKSKKYHEMDISKSLVDNLSGKNIVEHPIFLIILNHHSNSFDLEGSADDESDGEEQATQVGQGGNKNTVDKIVSITTTTPNLPCEISLSGNEKANVRATSCNSQYTSPMVNPRNENYANVNISQQLSRPPPTIHIPTTSSTPVLSHGTMISPPPIHPISSSNVSQPTLTRKEAEFNKTCYDFYLKYYNEKYGVSSNDVQTINGTSHNSSIPSPHNKTSLSNDSRTNNRSGELLQNPSRSAQSLVARQLLDKSKNAGGTSIELKVSTPDEQSEKGKNEIISDKTKGNSLQLLAVYSDSEEEDMDA